MKIVLLSGMDGTGELFYNLLPLLTDFQTHVIPLPQTGDQDYDTLSSYVISRLPDDDFIIIAESFSGPIAAQLTQKNIDALKGVVFVATFLSTPSRYFLPFARWLPMHVITCIPFHHIIIRYFLLGQNASHNLVTLFLDTVTKQPPALIKERIKTIQKMKVKDFTTDLPAIYLRAQSDKLVSHSKGNEFNYRFKNLQIEELCAPHFLLQAEPEKSAAFIRKFISERYTDNDKR